MGACSQYQAASDGFEMTQVDPRLLFEMAENAEPDTTKRYLLLIAAIDAILESDVVLVGGSAVNLHTGMYNPTDIDLVAGVGVPEREQLASWGFSWAGIGHRHLSYEFSDGEIALVEFPSSTLDGTRPPAWWEAEPGTGIWVIALDDLMMDRLRQATDGSLVTFEAAVSLARAMSNSLDWASLEVESQSPGNKALGVEGYLVRVRTAADHGAPGE